MRSEHLAGEVAIPWRQQETKQDELLQF
jgi:hypothetical protein